VNPSPRELEESRTKSALAADIVCKYGKLRLCVTGFSMVPTLWPGDMVTVERKLPAQVLPGELVVAENLGHLRLHRVVESSFAQGDNRLITRGDSCPANDDPPVMPDQVLGVVASIERRGASFVPRSQRPRIACLFSRLIPLGVRLTRIAFRFRRLFYLTSTRETPTLEL